MNEYCQLDDHDEFTREIKCTELNVEDINNIVGLLSSVSIDFGDLYCASISFAALVIGCAVILVVSLVSLCQL
jgi:hypothetical protein